MFIVYIILGCLFTIFLVFFVLAYCIHHKAFGKRWDPDGIIKYYEKEEYVNFNFEEVVIPFKKIKLRGFLYYYSKERSKGIIVFAHGMWGSHRAYIQELEILARSGYKVLGFDYKGTELSDGKSISGLGNSLASLDYAIKYIKQAYPKERIFVMGHSWGGFAALGIAKYHPDLAGIIAMAPFLNERRVLKTMLPRFIHFLIPFILFIDGIKCGGYSFINTIKVLKETKVKTFLLHSKDDNMIPYQSSTQYLIQHLKNENIYYKIVEERKHNPDYTIEAIRYTNAVVSSLKKIKNEEEKLEFRKNINYHKMGEIDEEVFQSLVQFLNSL